MKLRIIEYNTSTYLNKLKKTDFILSCNTSCNGRIKNGSEFFCGDKKVQKKSGDTSACGSGNNQSSNCVTVTGSGTSQYPGPGWIESASNFTSEKCDPEDPATKNNVTKLCNMALGLNRSDYYTPGTKPSCNSSCTGISNAVKGTNCMWCGDEIIDGSENCEVVSNGIKYGNSSSQVFDLISLSEDFDESTTWSVPISGTYEITVYGAKGGKGSDGEDGSSCDAGVGRAGADGGKTIGSYNLTKGETLTLTIGTKGGDGSIRSGGKKGQTDGNPGTDGNSNSNDGGGGGGGGGSSSVKATRGGSTVTLIQAYGGGGGGGGEGGGQGLGSWCNDGKDGKYPSGSTGGAASGNNASNGGDGGPGGDGGGSNYCNSSYVVGTCSKSSGAKENGNGYISIALKKYPPCNSCKFATNTSDYIDVKERKAACTNLAEHAHWLNGTGQITQTYSTSWTPSTDGGHGTDSTKCYFQCDDNYTWESGGDPAVHSGWHCIHEKTAACIGLPLSNAVWSSNNSTTKTITLTYSGADGSGSWEPSTSGTYNTSTTANQCYYKCVSGYHNEGGACVSSADRVYTCSGKPSNAVWTYTNGESHSYTQSWSDSASAWIPAASSATPNTTPSATECRYKCKEHYEGSSCTAETKSFKCTGKPANTVWTYNNSEATEYSYTQTWDGSAFTPAASSVTYGTSSSGPSCLYKCKSGYDRIDNTCKKVKWSFEDAGDDTASGNIVSVDNSASYHWSRMTTLGANSGSYAMCSDNNKGVDGATATMTITVNMPETGMLYFYIKGDGENNATSNYDTFNLYVDGSGSPVVTSKGVNYNSSNSTTGWSSWTKQSVLLSSGTHTLKFDYKKDGSTSYGNDRFCVDDLSFKFIDPSSIKTWGFENNSWPTTWLSGSASSWALNSSYKRSGSNSYCSTNTSDSSSGTLTLSLKATQEGVVTIYVYGTSESCCDYLTIEQNGSQVWTSKGSNYESWTLVSFPVSSGTIPVKFTYQKDYSVSNGIDQYCIDDLTFTPLP